MARSKGVSVLGIEVVWIRELYSFLQSPHSALQGTSLRRSGERNVRNQRKLGLPLLRNPEKGSGDEGRLAQRNHSTYTVHVHFRSILGTFAFSISLLLPVSAFAMRTQSFEFGAGAVNATWEGKGPISMQQRADGILLRSTGTGLFITDDELAISPQLGSLTITAEKSSSAYLFWVYDDDTNSVNYTLPIFLPKGERVVTSFSLSEVENWHAYRKKIGILLTPNTSVLLHRIDFNTLNPFERMLERIRSFWTFDQYRPYSINFLWGPQIADNPVLRSTMFRDLPAKSVSGTFTANILLAAIVLVIAFSMRGSTRTEGKRKALLATMWILLVSWIFFDVRMGMEFLTYVGSDIASYSSKPESTRVFRDRDRFYDFAAFANSSVADRDSYIFFAEQQWPYLGNMRYLTYPAIPGIDFASDDTWVIYRRSDVGVDPEGRLTIEGQIVSEPGRIIGRFDSTSFIFRTNNTPTPPSQ